MPKFELEDDTPWASPEIRESYEAALGRFILAFNQLDDLLSDLVEIILKRLGRQDLAEKIAKEDFWLKLLTLDLTRSSNTAAAAANVPIDLMKAIEGERNVLAHGHFDQNPFDGSYAVVRSRKSVHEQYSTNKLLALIKQTKRAEHALRQALAHCEFSDLPSQ
jgi:hypothetical protein